VLFRSAVQVEGTISHKQVVEQAVFDMQALIHNTRGFGRQTTKSIIRALPRGEAFLDAFEERGGAGLLGVQGVGEKKASALLRAFKARGGKLGMLKDARARMEAAEQRAASWRKWRKRLIIIGGTVWIVVAAWWAIEDPETSFWVALGWPLYAVLAIIALVIAGSATTRVRGYTRRDGTYVSSHDRSR